MSQGSWNSWISQFDSFETTIQSSFHLRPIGLGEWSPVLRTDGNEDSDRGPMDT